MPEIITQIQNETEILNEVKQIFVFGNINETEIMYSVKIPFIYGCINETEIMTEVLGSVKTLDIFTDEFLANKFLVRMN